MMIDVDGNGTIEARRRVSSLVADGAVAVDLAPFLVWKS